MLVGPQRNIFTLEFLHWNSEKKRSTLTGLRELVVPDHIISDYQGHWDVRENINKNLLQGKGKQDVIGNKRPTAFLDLHTGRFMPPDPIIRLKDLKSRKCLDGTACPLVGAVSALPLSEPIQATGDVKTDGAGSMTDQFGSMHLVRESGSSFHHSQYLPSIATSGSHYQDQGTHSPPSRPTSNHDTFVTSRSRSDVNIRYLAYTDESVRLDTFVYCLDMTNWPHDGGIQDTSTLAKHGLFFTRRADLCRCFCCGLGLKDWSKDDDPLFVHLKYSPNCGHLIKTIDANLLSVYRRNIQLTTEGNSNAVINPGTPNTVKHPEFQEYQERLASFSSWQLDLMQTPTMLAEAGFFHTGVRDIVRCYACDGGLQRWDAGDQPWIEHARWFPYCEHVRRVKGEDYIRIVQAAAETFIDEDNTEPEIPTDSQFALYSIPAQKVVDMGYSKAAVAIAIDECKAKDLRLTAENLSNILLEKEDIGEVLPTDSPRSGSPPPPQLNAVTKQDLLEEQEYLRRRLLCIFCGQRESNILFLPCGHHKMCAQCSDTVKECSVCFKVIQQKVKTFMS